MYALYALIAVIFDVLILAFNNLATGQKSPIFLTFFRSFLTFIASFILVLCFGHLFDLGKIFQNTELLIWVIMSGIILSIQWISYFYSIHSANINDFTFTNISSLLFFSNTLSLIFTTSVVTNGIKPFNIVLYSFSIIFLLFVIIVFVKKNLKGIGWVVLSLICGLCHGATYIIINVKIGELITPDIINFYQLGIIAIISGICTLFTKKMTEFKFVTSKEFLFLFLGAIVESFYTYFAYKAASLPSANIAIITSILSLTPIIYYIVRHRIHKEKIEKVYFISICLFACSIALAAISGLI